MITRRSLLQVGLVGAGTLFLPETRETSILTKNGNRYWYVGEITDPEPGLYFENGQMYFGGALVHRDNGPAVEFSNGDWIWKRDGKTHREGGPAERMTNIGAFGKKNVGEFWHRNGRLHREGGPAISWSNGTEFWYREGQLHRLDGPASHCMNTQITQWYVAGVRHRLDGPAKIYFNGHCEWWENGHMLSCNY